MIAELLQAKRFSDRGEYDRKMVLMRRLLAERPDEFMIDSREGGIVGLTHTPTGFRIHIPARAVAAKRAFVESPSVSFRGPTIGRALGIGVLGAIPGGALGILAGGGLEELMKRTGHTQAADSTAMKLLQTILRGGGAAAGGMVAQSYDNQFDHRYWDHEGNKLKRPKKDERLEAEEKTAAVNLAGLFRNVGRAARAGAGVSPHKAFFASPAVATKNLWNLLIRPRFPGQLGRGIDITRKGLLAYGLYGAGSTISDSWDKYNRKLDGLTGALPLPGSVKEQLDSRWRRATALPKVLADSWLGTHMLLPQGTPEPPKAVGIGF
jgi:hypothetical protein